MKYVKIFVDFTAQGCGKNIYPNPNNKVVICEGG